MVMGMRVGVPLLCALLVVSGCGRRHRYDWGSYDQSVHAMYTDPSNYNVDEDLERLATELERTPRERIPPGKAAHIGMLYSIKGDQVNARRYFVLEKELFIEAQPLMDRLIARSEAAR
jgi:hypothetical protein